MPDSANEILGRVSFSKDEPSNRKDAKFTKPVRKTPLMSADSAEGDEDQYVERAGLLGENVNQHLDSNGVTAAANLGLGVPRHET